jgi:outer membrane receptor protein involved in Fe transport
MKLRFHHLSRSAMLASVSLAWPVFAQEATTVDQSTSQSSTLAPGDIVVTASRRQQAIIDVPYNISAVGSETLTRNNVTDYSALVRLVPGLAYIDRGPRDAGASNNLIIRGIGTRPAAALSPPIASADTVSTYLGETPLYVNLAIKDIERVEVLRGPQGTLYGSGSAGGTIRFIFNKPDPGEFSGNVTGTASLTKKGAPSGSFDAVVNVPLSDKAALRVLAGYERQGGFVDERFLFKRDTPGGRPSLAQPNDIVNSPPILETKKDTDDADIYYTRASLRLMPSDAVDLQLNYQYQNNDVGNAPGVNPGYMGNDRYSGSQRRLASLKSEAHLVNFDGSVDFGFATVASSTSYYRNDVRSSRDNTGAFETAPFGQFYIGNPRFIAETNDRIRESGFIQELRLTSNDDGPIEYIVGGFYQDLKRRLVLDEILTGYSEWRRATGINPFGGPLPADFNLPGDRDFLTDESQRFKEIAFFGEVTYNVTDRLHLTGGARFFWQNFRSNARFEIPQTEILFGPGAGSATGSGRNKINDHIFKVNASYDITRDLKTYATFSQGFRRGGANALPTTGPFGERAALNNYRPDTVDNYEIGLKGQIGRAVTFSTAIFQINWKDIQLTPTSAAAGQPFVANGGKARSRGVEFEATAQVGESLSLSMGYAFTDAKLTSDFEIRTLDINSGDPTGAIAASGFAGQRTPGTPKHSLTGSVDYRIDMGNDAALILHGNGTYRSSILRNLTSTLSDAYTIKGVALFDASVGYEKPSWGLTAYVENIFNAKGVSSVAANEPDVVSRQRVFFVARPVTVGLRLAYRWGKDARR